MLRFWQIARDTRILPDQLRPEDLPALTSQLVQFRGGARVEDMDAWGVVLVGSPETVAARVQEIADTIAPTTLAGEFSFGSLTHEQVTRSIRLFAEEVIPRLRLDDRAVASGER
jgi:alkanesulfonate monooxygenase SsuD/methylene tetrahydromethanopterin reductase-like flavin-dependent oxidoreductase (luciferase family)